VTGQERQREDICGPCRIGECKHCDGNIDLKPGGGPAVPLARCAHACSRGRVRQVKA
jgi:hypothetical protein